MKNKTGEVAAPFPSLLGASTGDLASPNSTCRKEGPFALPEHHLFSRSTKIDPQKVTKLLDPHFWKDLRTPLGDGGGSTSRGPAGAHPWA